MSECEIPQFYQWTEPVARKKHHCCECNAPIEVGEKHFSWRGKWEGEISAGRQHFLCMEACMFVRDVLNGLECIPFGDLWDFYQEYRHDISDHPRFREFLRMMVKIKIRQRRSKKP